MTLFAAVRLANLPISLARRKESGLAEMPLLLVVRDGAQQRVAAVSEPGRDDGRWTMDERAQRFIAVGMTLRQARLRLPDAQVRLFDQVALDTEVAGLRRLLHSFSPRIMLAMSLPDLCLIADLGRASQALAMQWADYLIETVWSEHTLLPSVGLAADLRTAQLAAQVIPAGAASLILPGQEAAFLAAQPVSLLPISQSLIERLRAFGLRTIGQVAALPRDALQAQFGSEGSRLADLARASMPAALVPDAEAVPITVGLRFISPVGDGIALLQVARRLAEQLARQLDRAAAGAAALRLTIDLADLPAVVHTRQLAPPSADPERINAVLSGLFTHAPPSGPVERLLLSATELTLRPTGQLTLFPAEQQAAERLFSVLPRLERMRGAELIRAVPDVSHSGCLERQVRLERWS